jgi:hypothetical protein
MAIACLAVAVLPWTADEGGRATPLTSFVPGMGSVAGTAPESPRGTAVGMRALLLALGLLLSQVPVVPLPCLPSDGASFAPASRAWPPPVQPWRARTRRR